MRIFLLPSIEALRAMSPIDTTIDLEILECSQAMPARLRGHVGER